MVGVGCQESFIALSPKLCHEVDGMGFYSCLLRWRSGKQGNYLARVVRHVRCKHGPMKAVRVETMMTGLKC
jgi:hypothetical protein